uniref:Uncharacterized protein n=1 Tax=viral metagenome TaxID=1070528 RepID=A0A6C0DIU2_9ZZZZ
MSAKDIHFLLNLRNQIKLHHWQTKVYARHIATDGAVDKLDELIDQYVEVYMGKYGRPKLTGDNAIIRLHNLTEAGATRLVKTSTTYLLGPFVKGLTTADTDLINIRDEIVAQLHQLLFLFTLH